MNTYLIWSEGYCATGESASAHCHGSAKGETFKDACIAHFKSDKFFNPETLRYWGCRLFNNEADARKAFG
jgi:hypothetical protein